jgi:hypothetical protein
MSCQKFVKIPLIFGIEWIADDLPPLRLPSEYIFCGEPLSMAARRGRIFWPVIIYSLHLTTRIYLHRISREASKRISGEKKEVCFP